MEEIKSRFLFLQGKINGHFPIVSYYLHTPSLRYVAKKEGVKCMCIFTQGDRGSLIINTN